jgi:hypothetical protein
MPLLQTRNACFLPVAKARGIRRRRSDEYHLAKRHLGHRTSGRIHRLHITHPGSGCGPGAIDANPIAQPAGHVYSIANYTTF